MSNFVPHELVIFNDRDPPWMTNKIKTVIHQKNLAFKKINCNIPTERQLRDFNNLQIHLENLIILEQDNYYSKLSKSLSNPTTSSKCY